MSPRTCLTLKQKLQVHLKLKQNPGMNNPMLAEWIYATFKARVSRATLARLRNLPSSYFSHVDLSATKRRRVKFPQFERELREFFFQNEAKTAMADDVLLLKAHELAGRLGIDSTQLRFSNGWLQSFKKRNGIRSHVLHGEGGAVEDDAVRGARLELQELVAQSAPDDVFNFDETALFYRLAPNSSRPSTGTASTSTRQGSGPRGRSPSGSSTASRASRRAFDGQDARRAYLQLQEREAERVRKRARHHHDPLPSSDEEEDSPHPLLDTFRDSIGDEGIQSMTNFTPTEIVRLYGFLSDFMSTRLNVGRRKRSSETAVDMFFMTLSVLKNGGDWGVLATSFGAKPPAFEKMIVRFLEILSPHLYALYVEDAAKTESMKKVALSGHSFRHYPAARYAVDVIFQQSTVKSGGTQEERAGFYNAKHKLHGYKTELSVTPTGIAINCSTHDRGSVADITIFRNNKAFHEATATKLASEETLPDDGPLQETYPSAWIIIADKGYQGLAETHRVVHPKRRLPSAPLTLEEEATNHNISSDRSIIANYFGRLCTLWALCSDKYRWKEARYEMYFRACVALTNVQVRAYPLGAEDGEHYRDYLRRLSYIGTTQLARRRDTNRRARERRQLRLAMEVPPVNSDSEVASDDN
ncbi:succinyl-CoA:3-ketoacid coenzyme A transferase [Phytophthora cinnamomi]|uniref:succinyl-CoA:3-ketoacid coenzyme A transferase n=1 Tax=Phytophthora cinnamomi TaxID=4785 RepID=UPI00355A498A|nr:succinyl-CoA:3-ketoacid coenzyme A transferase [Phytophthora cinnamomi]